MSASIGPTGPKSGRDPGRGPPRRVSERDWDLFCRGDRQAAAKVFNAFDGKIRLVVASLAKTLDDDEREDMVQEINVRVWERREMCSGADKLEGWVYRLAVNHCKDRLRARESRPDMLSLDHQAELNREPASDDPRADPHQQCVVAFLGDRLREAMATLPPRQVQAFYLVKIERCKAVVAAKIMGVTAGTVRSNLRHAVARLRKMLGDLKDDYLQ